MEAPFRVLKIGEQEKAEGLEAPSLGKRDYENALEDEDVMAHCKTLHSQLLARVDEHIAKLEYLQATA